MTLIDPSYAGIGGLLLAICGCNALLGGDDAGTIAWIVFGTVFGANFLSQGVVLA